MTAESYCYHSDPFSKSRHDQKWFEFTLRDSVQMAQGEIVCASAVLRFQMVVFPQRSEENLTRVASETAQPKLQPVFPLIGPVFGSSSSSRLTGVSGKSSHPSAHLQPVVGLTVGGGSSENEHPSARLQPEEALR